jgi:hypothetical protein
MVLRRHASARPSPHECTVLGRTISLPCWLESLPWGQGQSPAFRLSMRSWEATRRDRAIWPLLAARMSEA